MKFILSGFPLPKSIKMVFEMSSYKADESPGRGPDFIERFKYGAYLILSVYIIS